MNGIPSLYQMTPTGVPFRTGARGESTSEQRYFVPGFSTAPAIPLTPEQQADQMLAAQRRNYAATQGDGSGAPIGDPSEPSPVMGSSGGLGGIAQGLGGVVAGIQNTLGPLSMAVPGLGIADAISQYGQDLAIDANARTDAALAKANEQANQAKVTTPFFGFGPQVTTAVDIAPVAGSIPGTQQVTSIAPDVVAPGNPITDLDVNVDPTAALTAMNQQTQTQQTQATPASIAATVADAVANFADTQDAEAGTNAAAAAAANAGTAGTTGGDGVGGVGSAGNEGGSQSVEGNAPSIGGSMDAFGSNDSPSDSSDDGDGDYRMGGRVINYAQGGVASLANRVQDKGRGQDTMLVHMTPKEVGGLQALAMAHGGSLTINPQTGLPEAGFLSSILPMVAGAALAATGVGAPMAAMLVGGGSYLMNPKQGLMGGLLAGLGAYGGYGLGSALGMAGGAASTAGQAITPAVAQTAAVTPQAAVSATPQVGGIGTIGGGGFGAISPTSALAPSVTSPIVNPNLVSTVASPPTLGQMGQGVQNLFTKPGTFDQVVGTAATKTAPATGLGGGLGAIKTVGMAAAPIIAGMGEESSGLPVQDQFIRPFKYRARPASEEDENFRYRTGERGEPTGEQRYFGSTYTPVGVFKAGTEPAYGTYAMGGDIEEGVKNGSIRSFDDEYGQDEYAGGGLTAFKAGGLQDGGFVVPADVVAHLGNGSTDAGLRLLAKTLKAKPIKGSGDGMSDSIPTTIGGKQPARVADGEAYISPEVTKKVGSERLYAMMDRIRKAKTGKKKQAPEINTRNYVPA